MNGYPRDRHDSHDKEDSVGFEHISGLPYTGYSPPTQALPIPSMMMMNGMMYNSPLQSSPMNVHSNIPMLDQLANAAQHSDLRLPIMSSENESDSQGTASESDSDESDDDQETYSSAGLISGIAQKEPVAYRPGMSSSHSVIIIPSSEEDEEDEERRRFRVPRKSSSEHEENFDQIKYEHIKFGKSIGEGSFGEVYAAKLWSQPVAVKVLRIDSNEADKRYKKYQKEVAIMRSLRHPNIVEFMGISLVHADPISGSPAKLCIVTELLPNGNLEDLLEKRSTSWKRLFRFAKDIASGLNWLHHKGIIHRDLKPSNLLVTANYHIKIADFGLSHMRNNPGDQSAFYSMCGTRCYIAPEVIQKDPYNHKADVFSFGVVLCEMIDGRYPFETIDSRETTSFNDAVLSGTRPRMPDSCPPELKKLIEMCWRDNPRERPDMDQIIEILAEIEGPIVKATHNLLDEDLEEVSEEVKNAIQEERLRLTEAQSELAAERSRCQALDHMLKASQAKLNGEIAERKKAQQRLRKLYKERQDWMNEIEGVDPPQTRSKSSISSESKRRSRRPKKPRVAPAVVKPKRTKSGSGKSSSSSITSSSPRTRSRSKLEEPSVRRKSSLRSSTAVQASSSRESTSKSKKRRK